MATPLFDMWLELFTSRGKKKTSPFVYIFVDFDQWNLHIYFSFYFSYVTIKVRLLDPYIDKVYT